MANSKQAFERRRDRVRRSVKKVANGRPRLSVFRSSKQIYAQIIDDGKGQTIASASTSKEHRNRFPFRQVTSQIRGRI